MEMLRAACEQFLGKTAKQVMNIAKETLEGHQRAIMCTMSVEVSFPGVHACIFIVYLCV